MSDPEAAITCNCLAICQAARHVTQIYDQHLAPAGLRTTQFSVLARLDRLGPVAIHELAACLVMDRTTMGRALRPLEREGLVAIGPGPDGRTRALTVTPAGEGAVTASHALVARGATGPRSRLRLCGGRGTAGRAHALSRGSLRPGENGGPTCVSERRG